LPGATSQAESFARRAAARAADHQSVGPDIGVPAVLPHRRSTSNHETGVDISVIAPANLQAAVAPCRAIVMPALRPIHYQEETTAMSKLIACALSSLIAASVLFAQVATAATAAAPAAAASDCASKAIDKNGKPLAGAAKSSFMKKCEADAKGGAAAGSGCAEKAVGKNGKPLAGAAKASFMKKCEADAKSGK
jgi:hypothetical protein